TSGTGTYSLSLHDALPIFEVTLDSRDLEPWDDFINGLRGVDAEPVRITGRAQWQGRVLGPLEGPTFAGHVKGWQASYDRLYWDRSEEHTSELQSRGHLVCR